MIVISGALVLVAAVLLVLGIISSITLVYAAIGLSIVSAVFLLVGVFQRPAPASEPRESESEGTRRQASQRDADEGDEADSPPLTRKSVSVSKPAEATHDEPPAEPAHEPVDHIDLVDADEISADFPLEKSNADFEARSGATGADVLVISGRPRYHVGGCEYVEGNDDSEPLEINEARELGFTPCGACRPNETLARSAAGKEHAAHPKPSPVSVSQPATASYEPAPVAVAAAAPVADAQQNHVAAAAPQQAAPVAPVSAPPPVSEPVAFSPPPAAVEPVAEPITAAPPVATTPPVAPPPPAAAERATAPQVAAPVAEPPVAEPPVTGPPAAEPPATGRAGRAARTVLALASTKEYHRPDCEMLTGAQAEEITKVAAIRQGYLACGICKP
ncbi:MAG TPA: hypothetical protein VHX15_03485 [Frankiaceae bacterium]|nr:hypothetical protein [Frankiaceae bacterium]